MTLINKFRVYDFLTKKASRHLQEAESLLKHAITQTVDLRTKGHLAGQLHRIQRRLSSAFLWFSQHGQDRWLDEVVFKGLRNGVFLDIGAYDGVTGSNSLFFEAFRNWTGLLVEASPRLALQSARHRSQPVANCAIGAITGKVEFLEVLSGYTQMGGITHLIDEETLRQIRSHPNHAEKCRMVPVKGCSLLLRTYDLDHIDIVFIDVEGAEEEVLESFPFESSNPVAFCVENNALDDRFVTLMHGHGYVRVAFIGVDEVFLRRDKAEQLDLPKL